MQVIASQILLCTILDQHHHGFMPLFPQQALSNSNREADAALGDSWETAVQINIYIALELTHFLGQTGTLFYAFPPASPTHPSSWVTRKTLSEQELQFVSLEEEILLPVTNVHFASANRPPRGRFLPLPCSAENHFGSFASLVLRVHPRAFGKRVLQHQNPRYCSGQATAGLALGKAGKALGTLLSHLQSLMLCKSSIF